MEWCGVVKTEETDVMICTSDTGGALECKPALAAWSSQAQASWSECSCEVPAANV